MKKDLIKLYLLLILLMVSAAWVSPVSGRTDNPKFNTTIVSLSPVVRGELFSFCERIPLTAVPDARIWIFGKNYLTIDTLPVKNDGSINISLDTSNLSAGKYFILVQEPGTDSGFDISYDNHSQKVSNRKKIGEKQVLFTLAESRTMDPRDMLTILLREFEYPGIGDQVYAYSLEVPEPYITIYPVGDHAVGDIINITGTTNLPVNTTLYVSAGPVVFTNYEPNYFIGQTLVIQGQKSNIWSIVLNTSRFSIDEYSLFVEPLNKNPLIEYTKFNVTPKRRIPQTTLQENYANKMITLDPITPHYQNESFTITGTTDLPPGDELLIEVFSLNHTLGPKGTDYSGAVGVVNVREELTGKNIWSFTVNSSDLKPDDYKVVVTSYRYGTGNDSSFSVSSEKISNRSSSISGAAANPVNSPTPKPSPLPAVIVMGSLLGTVLLLLMRER